MTRENDLMTAMIRRKTSEVMKTAGLLINVKAKELQSAEPGLAYKDAVKKVLLDDPQLMKSYQEGI